MSFKTAILSLPALFMAPLWAFLSVAPALAETDATTQATEVVSQRDSTSTADHGRFEVLWQDFKSGPEVTRACLTCHTEAAKQVQKTKHWTWEFLNPATGQQLGKKHVINNFCTAVPSNYEFCTACHVGYGWKDQHFDFGRQENVDCLVCHDTTDTYKKLPGLAGHPTYEDREFPPKSGKIARAPDLGHVARNVGKTRRENCGACHFYGGGGDAVKHGDLDSSLNEPAKSLDVHMDRDGLDFSCGECHRTSGHEVPGSRYAVTAVDKAAHHMRGKPDANPASCQACHSDTPHKGPRAQRLNGHTAKLACQTCHIPEFARGQPTKMRWDWSTAGQMDAQGKPFQRKDADGLIVYDSKKGDFGYGRDVVPEYIWFNGQVDYTLREDKLDTSRVVELNRFHGSPTDGRSKIWPIKRFSGKQPYDVGNNQLLVFNSYGAEDAAFWTHFDWDKAIEHGMREIGAEYSGQYAFVSTEMSWPITHMVAPKDKALSCAQCHAPAEGAGRLDTVPGIYLPGRHGNALLDTAGWSLAGLTLLGVLGHGAGRIFFGRRSRNQSDQSDKHSR